MLRLHSKRSYASSLVYLCRLHVVSFILPHLFGFARGVDAFVLSWYTQTMKHDLHLKLTVRLFSDDHQRCFGPGVATLLHRVEEHHSLRSAAASMDMAYSKAWRIIRTAEEVFGCKLLSSTIGGARGGGAVLTPEATQLLQTYDDYCQDVLAYSSQRFEESFLPNFKKE